MNPQHAALRAGTPTSRILIQNNAGDTALRVVGDKVTERNDDLLRQLAAGPDLAGHASAAVLTYAEVLVAEERTRCAALCRSMMPAHGVIRATLLDLERAIMRHQGDGGVLDGTDRTTGGAIGQP